jgi:hypothetical protein
MTTTIEVKHQPYNIEPKDYSKKGELQFDHESFSHS